MAVPTFGAPRCWAPAPVFDDPQVLSRTLTRRILPQVAVPGRYIGGELGADRDGFDPGGVNVLLAFPDAYEVGMSHQGLRILYTLLQRPGTFCDLAFAPWPDMEQRMREQGMPLFGLESRRPARQFDLVGFSLGYELCYSNLLTMIDLAGSPLPADQRSAGDPIFLAGGSCTLNPAVVGSFLDVMLLGDGEAAIQEAAAAVAELKAQGADRAAILARLRALPGAWHPGVKGPVRARVIVDLNDYPPPAPLVPVIEPVHDRLSLEVMRGCVRGCRFCQAGMITRPVRERSAENLLAAARLGLAASGYEEISLLSLSTADYTGLDAVVGDIQDELQGTRTNLVLPSLRVDSVAEDLYERISRERPASFTFAPEAGSQRLRDVINKNITQEQIVTATGQALRAGVKTVKLYFMIGLPTETNEDLDELVALVGKVVGAAPRGGSQLHVSISPFAPKAHTPFQWAGQISRAEIERRNQYVGRPLQRMGVKVSLREPEVSWLEALLGLGDERLSAAVVKAWEAGARFDGWSEHFAVGRWERALAECGIDPEPYLAPRDPAAPLPWDTVDVGLTKTFLQRDWERAGRGRTLPDCRLEGPCFHCGPCHDDLQHVFSPPTGAGTPDPVGGAQPSGRVAGAGSGRPRPQADPAGPQPAFDPRNADPDRPDQELKRWTIWRQQAAAKCWYRGEFQKTGDLVFLGHLDFQRHLQLALRRSGLPAAYSKGYHPHPLLKFGPPLAVGVAGLRECLDLALEAECPGWEAELNRALPAGLVIRRQLLIGSQAPVSIDQSVRRFDYRIELPGPQDGGPAPDLVDARIKEFLASESRPLVRQRPKGDLQMDARRLVLPGALRLSPEPSPDGGAVVEVALLRTEAGAGLPVLDFLTALLGQDLPVPGSALITRTGYYGLQTDGRWLSPLEEVGESRLRFWLGRHLAG